MKKIVLIMILITGIACSQKKEQLKKDEKQNEKIYKYKNPKNMPVLTEQNFMETISKERISYPKEIMNYIYVHNFLCNYEVYINDFLMCREFKGDRTASPIYINYAILKSGPVKITYKVYPLEGEKTISHNADFSIKVGFQDLKKDYSHQTVSEHIVPKIKTKEGFSSEWEVFAGYNKPVYEGGFGFVAEVPYKVEGWSKGQNLAKLDRKKLEEEVLKFYKNQWNIMNQKDINARFSFVYKRERERVITMIEQKKDMELTLKTYLEPRTLKNYEMQPLGNYKFQLYAYGKMICMEQTSLDPRLRKRPILWAKYEDEDGDIRVFFPFVYLYLPEGKELKAENFEIIR